MDLEHLQTVVREIITANNKGKISGVRLLNRNVSGSFFVQPLQGQCNEFPPERC